jgi:hypothetical protein
MTRLLTSAGRPASLRVHGHAGAVLFVYVPSTTLPDGCGAIRLAGPGGATLRAGCLRSGSGFVDRTVLPSTGDYHVVLNPGAGRSGAAMVSVSTVVDDHQLATVDSTAVTGRVGEPGAAAFWSFIAPAAGAVYVTVSGASVADECGVVSIRTAAGAPVASGCVVHGTGWIDATRLTAGVTYQVVIDPAGSGTGSARVRITSVVDQQASVTVGGVAVRSTIAAPGAVTVVTFTGTAGRTVAVRASGATLPDACGVLRLLGPRGRAVPLRLHAPAPDPATSAIASGCLVAGAGRIAPATLPVTGTYAVVVDPPAGDTGAVSVQVTPAS